MPEPKSSPSDLRLNDPQSFNPYVYCTNNPLRYVDPVGEAFYSVETNQLLYTKDIVDLIIQTVGSAQRGEQPTMPFYYKSSFIDEVKTQGFWKTVTSIFSYTPAVFTFGKEQKTVEGYVYYPIMASGDPLVALGIPISKVSPEILGKNTSGEHILKLQFGGTLIQNGKNVKGSSFLMQLTGTVEQLNKMLRQEGLQIINEGERDYKLIEREKGED